MQILLTPTTLAIVLVSLFPAPSVHSEPPIVYFSIKPIKTLSLPSLPVYKPMGVESLPYSPIGTYSNPFPEGQCTYGVASMKGDVTWTGNANQWADNARAQGKTVSDVPIVGAVAQSSRGSAGHVATVVGIRPGEVEITEMNYDNNGGVRTDWQPVDSYVYIYV